MQFVLYYQAPRIRSITVVAIYVFSLLFYERMLKYDEWNVLRDFDPCVFYIASKSNCYSSISSELLTLSTSQARCQCYEVQFYVGFKTATSLSRSIQIALNSVDM